LNDRARRGTIGPMARKTQAIETVQPTAKLARATPRLDPAERAVLDEAVARGESVRKTVDSAVAEYGQWIFTHVFGGDTTAVIDGRADNALWRELTDVADGPKLRLPAELIERAALCAAYDQRLNSDAWRALDFSRKSRLVRLGDDKLLRKAAQHALATNLSAKDTEAYVRALLRELGEPVQTRVSIGRVQTQLDRLSERYHSKEFLRRVESASRDADPEERKALTESIARMQAALAEVKARLKAR
jgi:hypothetical protein